MKKFEFLSVIGIASLVLFSCNRSEMDMQSGTAEVSITLTADSSLTSSVKSVSEDTLPDIADFTVEIFKDETGKRLYRDTYANASDTTLLMNGGNYTLSAFHGDSLKAGFGKACYLAKVPFAITIDDRHVTVSGVATLHNVKVAVSYGDAIQEFYTDFVSSVSTDKTKVTDTLSFSSTETRAGFIPAGNLTLKVFAKVDGKWMYYKAEPVEASPADFITFNVDTAPVDGQLTIGVTIVNDTDDVSKEIEIDATEVATEAPVITLGKDFSDNALYFFEGSTMSESQVNVVAKAGISEAYLNVTSDYLTALGVPSQVDLVNAGTTVRAALKSAGISWLQMDSTTRYSSVDFSNMGSKITYDSTNPFSASFTLTIKDKNGNETTSDTFTAELLQKATLNISDYNAFAKSLRQVTLETVSGDPEKYTLQYRVAGTDEWVDAGTGTVSGSTVTFDKIAGLSPETSYDVRFAYNGNLNLGDGSYQTVTTEAAAQVGNAGFEEWSTETITFSVAIIGTEISMDWYKPYSSDAWWAVNSKQSMGNTSVAVNATSYYLKNCPTVAYSSDCSDGEYAAHIFSVNVGSTNTYTAAGVWGTNYGGELFIGTADDDGNHSTDGHTFASRPDKLTFKYKYTPYNSETFGVTLYFNDADGNIICSYEQTGESASDWTDYSMDIEWNDITKKAALIYISLKSCSSDSPKVQSATTMEIAGETRKGHFGSSLYVDDLQLIYE